MFAITYSLISPLFDVLLFSLFILIATIFMFFIANVLGQIKGLLIVIANNTQRVPAASPPPTKKP